MPFIAFLRINAPWLCAGFLLAFLSSFGQTFFISVFAGEIRADFDLSHGAWGGIYTLGTSASAVAMLFAGGLTDRFRVRSLGAVVLVLLALACLFMAVNRSVWALPLVIFALRFSGQGMTSHISIVAMARWFVASRGRALAIAALGFSLGEATLPVGFVALMRLFDWRLLWVLAATVVLAALPLLLLLLRHERTPQSHAETSHAAGMRGRHWTRRAALQDRLFWLLVPALLGPPAFGTAFFFQQVHLAEVKGWAHVGLVALFPIYTVTSVLMMLASGWAVDRWGTGRLLPLYQLPLALFFVLMSGADTLAAASPIMVLMGLTTGAQATIPSAFWAEFYGTRHIGSIKAMAAAVMVLGSALGPGITGALIDAGIAFPQQMIGIGLYLIGAAALVRIAMLRARAALAMPA